jgi:hypothetical protein
MNTRNVNEIFISDGGAFNVDTTNIAAITAQLNFVGGDMTVAEGASITTATDPILYAVNKLANGDLKRSFPIKGANITGWKGQSYVPATREVWAIGHNRKTATGTIEVNNSTDYAFSIRFKWDKMFFSERPEVLDVTFTSAAAATQLSIATQIAGAINGSSFGSQPAGIKVVKAVVVGDGTGVYGLTGATDYGVEIWSLDVNQFANTQYKPLRVYFSVHVNDASGFEGTTTCTQIQANDYGSGTLEQISGIELFNYQFEGVLNRTSFPIPVLATLTATALTTSDVLGAFTATATISEDTVTFSAAASTELPAGSFILLDGAAYEIKYYISTTVAVLTIVMVASVSAVDVQGKAGYDVFNISFNDITTTAGANVGQFSNKQIMVASPAINTTNTDMTVASTSTTDIQTLLNAYMLTTPVPFTAVSL